jgi:hypothetical protein
MSCCDQKSHHVDKYLAAVTISRAVGVEKHAVVFLQVPAETDYVKARSLSRLDGKRLAAVVTQGNVVNRYCLKSFKLLSFNVGFLSNWCW